MELPCFTTMTPLEIAVKCSALKLHALTFISGVRSEVCVPTGVVAISGVLSLC